MYRDLKPENILIDIDGHIKVSDFGLAKRLQHKDDLSATFCGSPEYLSPEMLMGQKHSRAVDFYTLGCLTYELLIGIPPYY
jgi:serum/glucocorticoid-regulated kinase 2